MRHWTELRHIPEIDWSKIPGGTPEEWRARTKVRTKAEHKQGTRERNAALLRQLKRGPCSDCGGHFHPTAMEFDHRDNKRFEISKGRDASHVTLVEEIAKCDLVCACCHRVRTANRLAGLPATLPTPEYEI